MTSPYIHEGHPSRFRAGAFDGGYDVQEERQERPKSPCRQRETARTDAPFSRHLSPPNPEDGAVAATSGQDSAAKRAHAHGSANFSIV